MTVSARREKSRARLPIASLYHGRLGSSKRHLGLRGVVVLALALPGALPAWGDEGRVADLPYYVIEAIDIRGNRKTDTGVIRRELQIAAGENLSVNDPRFEESRFRVLSLGFFSDVRFRLEKGSHRGAAVLVVEVKERGTILVTDLFLGASRATDIWGGIGIADRNLWGRGILLEGAFVLASAPEGSDVHTQQSYWLRLGVPRIAGSSLEVNTTFLYLDGNDFFRQSGQPSSSDPSGFLPIAYRRVGGTVGIGFSAGHYVRMAIDYRGEAVHADIPSGAVRHDPAGYAEAIDFGIAAGNSVLSNIIVSLERDTRSDPVFPERGSLLRLAAAASTGILGSSFDYVKLTAHYRKFLGLPWRHVLALEIGGGAIFGEAPFFDRFFIGDFNDLVPERVLGLNFSTQPPPNLFGNAINTQRYEDIAVRGTVEYIVPWFREGRFFYAGDFFVQVGLVFLTSPDALRVRDQSLGSAIPIGLTANGGLRLDTRIGVVRLTVGNIINRIPL